MEGTAYSEAGIPLATSYGPADAPSAQSLPVPGEWPFTGGSSPGYEPDEKGKLRQLERLAEVKRARCGAEVTATLAELARGAAADDVNLMLLLIDCAKAYCTVGEMVDVLKAAWGEFGQPRVF